MSYRDAIIDIISIAQHAKPKLIGQIEFFRAQLIAFPIVVVKTLSENEAARSSTRAKSSGGWLSRKGLSDSTDPLWHVYPTKQVAYRRKNADGIGVQHGTRMAVLRETVQLKEFPNVPYSDHLSTIKVL